MILCPIIVLKCKMKQQKNYFFMSDMKKIAELNGYTEELKLPSSTSTGNYW